MLLRLGHSAVTNFPGTGPPDTSTSTEEPAAAVVHPLQWGGGALPRGEEDSGQQPSGRDVTTIIIALSKRVERLQAQLSKHMQTTLDMVKEDNRHLESAVDEL